MDTPTEIETIHHTIENILISTLSSMIAAGIVISFFYPLECIEAKMQLGQIEKSSLWVVLKSTRLSSHYLGCRASVIGHILAWGVIIFVSDLAKLFLEDILETELMFVVSYSLGAFFYTSVYTPFSTIKIRLITEPQHENSIKVYLRSLREARKISELYSGFAMSLFYIFEGVIQLGIYEKLKKEQETYFHFFLIGVLAKFIAISATYPYRVIVSILQSRPITLKQTLRMILKSSGLFGFYKGYLACLARQLPPSGFLFMILEFLRYLIKLMVHSS